MRKIRRLLKSFSRLVLPIVLLVAVAGLSVSLWLVYEVSHPKSAAYLVTPAKFGQLSSRAAQITDETWKNRDGSTARGWLLRGAENAPAVVLLHKYGADRSYCLNLGVKLNESTNYTVLMPDLRGHGQDPLVPYTTFGGVEASDALAAIEFLKTVRSADQVPLVGKEIGIYGVEMGAVSGLGAAVQNPNVKAILLDSVPLDSDGVIAAAVDNRFPFASTVTSNFARFGAKMYFYDGSFAKVPLCVEARSFANKKVMLLAGLDAPKYQDSTSKLGKCFTGNVAPEIKTDLSPSGFSITNASIEQSEAYDQRVIDFFRSAFGG